jgi:hypothetical protein
MAQTKTVDTPNEIVLLEHRLAAIKAERYADVSDDEFFLISSIDTILRDRALSATEIGLFRYSSG